MKTLQIHFFVFFCLPLVSLSHPTLSKVNLTGVSEYDGQYDYDYYKNLEENDYLYYTNEVSQKEKKSILKYMKNMLELFFPFFAMQNDEAASHNNNEVSKDVINTPKLPKLSNSTDFFNATTPTELPLPSSTEVSKVLVFTVLKS